MDLWKGGSNDETKKCTCIHCFVSRYDAVLSQIGLTCAEMLFLFPCFCACEDTKVFLTSLRCHLSSKENKCTSPTQVFKTRAIMDQHQRVKCRATRVFSDATTETGLNFKAQSHTLIWILKLSRCLGASNSSFSKTIIMTNLCISSLPNPLSMSLAWGNAAEKPTQICDMWLPIGNGLKLGTRMVWVKSKHANLVMVCTGGLTYCKIGPDLLELVAFVGMENLRWVWSHYCEMHIKVR